MALRSFEQIVRSAHLWTEEDDIILEGSDLHPFESRNIHPDLPIKVRRLFDDGYFPEATFEAFKFIEKEVKRIGGVRGKSGYGLMMGALDETNPSVKLNSLSSDSEIDEQRGYRYMFAGAQSGIRNPRGHDTDLADSPDTCLDHLSVASVLLRKLDEAGLR